MEGFCHRTEVRLRSTTSCKYSNWLQLLPLGNDIRMLFAKDKSEITQHLRALLLSCSVQLLCSQKWAGNWGSLSWAWPPAQCPPWGSFRASVVVAHQKERKAAFLSPKAWPIPSLWKVFKTSSGFRLLPQTSPKLFVKRQGCVPSSCHIWPHETQQTVLELAKPARHAVLWSSGL